MLKRFCALLLVLVPLACWQQARAAVAYVQRAQGVNTGYVNITPTANNLVCVASTTSAGGGSPTASFAFYSTAGGAGTNLGSLTVTMATANDGTYYVTGACGKAPSGVASVLATYAGGLPGEALLEAVELSGQDGTSPFLTGGMNQQSAPGTTANAITSGSVSVSSAAYILGICTNTSGDSDTIAGTGFTLRGTTTANFAVEDQTQASSGSYATTFTAPTHGASDYYHTFMFAIKANGGSSVRPSQFFMSGKNLIRRTPGAPLPGSRPHPWTADSGVTADSNSSTSDWRSGGLEMMRPE